MTRILVVDDEPSIVTVVTDRLLAEGYEVDVATRGDEAEARVREESYDVVLLDVMLPGRSGLDVCRNLRRDGIETPILMLTARDEVTDTVVGLRLGADDYITKPVALAELVARIEACLRRSPRRATAVAHDDGPTRAFGDVEVDEPAGEVRRNGERLELSAKEFDLLCYLLRHPGEVLTRERLLSDVWDYDAVPPTRTVDVHVSWLRQKLEPDPKRPRHIRTVHGSGYKFVP